MEDEVKADSDALARKLAEARRANSPLSKRAPDSSLADGMRIGSELVAGVLLGLGLGYLFDKWLNTSPFGMIVFLLLGIAGSMLNVYRALNGLDGRLGYRRKQDQKIAKD